MTDALDIMGDRHSLPVLREILYGFHRFSDIATLTGAPRTLLTSRLRKLEEAGVIHRQQYSEHPPRFEYYLTDAGAELVPVIFVLKEWGDRHAGASEPKAIFEHSCGDAFHPVTVCSSCRQQVDPAHLTAVGGTHPPTPPAA